MRFVTANGAGLVLYLRLTYDPTMFCVALALCRTGGLPTGMGPCNVMLVCGRSKVACAVPVLGAAGELLDAIGNLSSALPMIEGNSIDFELVTEYARGAVRRKRMDGTDDV